MNAQIRVLLAKVGPGGPEGDHDGGIRVLARALRDAGMDVIFAGSHRSPDGAVTAAIQEDADVLGISLHSDAQTVFPAILERLKREGAEDMIVVAGGTMADAEAASLKKIGVRGVLREDAPSQTNVETLRRLVAERGPR